MRTGTRTAAVAGMVALASAGAVACGSGSASQPGAGRTTGGPTGAGSMVQTAYVTTTHEKTAAFRLDETIQAKSSSGSSQHLTITGQGQANLATKAFAASLNTPAVGTVRMVLANGIQYIQLPPAARSQIPGHKPWVSLNLSKISQARLGTSFSQLSSVSNDDPTQVLSQLSAVSSTVSKVGSATVAGVPTTEYRAQVDLNKVAAQAQATEGAQAAQAVRQEIKALGAATLPVDVWIGPGHLVRQISFQAPIPAGGTSGASGGGMVTSTMTFTNFGAPVHVSPPPASQTVDITNELLQSAGTRANGA
jgi:hypothetical protein